MSVALALTPATFGPYDSVSVALTGATATTDYIISVGTTKVTLIECTTDGGGAATVLWNATGEGFGSVAFAVRPKAEYQGTTTAAATATGKKVAGNN